MSSSFVFLFFQAGIFGISSRRIEVVHAGRLIRQCHRWPRDDASDAHPQLLGCILVKAAKQCQLGSQIRFGHFLADLVQAASDSLPPRPTSAWPGTYRGEPGAALPQPYVEVIISKLCCNAVKYFTACTTGKSWAAHDEFNTSSDVELLAYTMYIDVLCFSLTSSDGICHLPNLFLFLFATSSNRF